jgi:hypothetical protein
MSHTSEEALPNNEELASLLLLVFYLEQLWPQSHRQKRSLRPIAGTGHMTSNTITQRL